MTYQQLFADFLSHCQAAAPPQPWARFAESTVAWRMPLNDTPMLAALAKTHSRKDLIFSGVAVPSGKDLDVSPILLNESRNILPLRTMPGDAPFDFITDQGSLRSALAMRSAVLDYQVSTAVGVCGHLFVSLDLEDSIRLRMIGLPAAPAIGLEQFSERSLRDFHYVFGLLPKKPPKVPHRLILVGWNLSRLSHLRSQMLDRVVENLTDNRACLGIPLHNVLVWEPTLGEIGGIANCLRIGRRQDVASAIAASIEQSNWPLSRDPAEPDPRTNLVECGRRLRDALVRSDVGRARRRNRMRDYERALDETVIEPLLAQAADEQDPKARSGMLGLAEFCRVFYPAVVVQRAKFKKEIIERGLLSNDAVAAIQGLLKGFETHYKMTKEDD